MQAMAGYVRERSGINRRSKLFTFAQLFAFIAVAVTMLPAAGHAQALLSTTAMLPDTPLPTFSADVQEVSLILTVTNKHGRFVHDLNPNDFSILDNDLPPERITFFQSETDLPLRVALVIDTSDSIMNRFKFEQRAAAEFLKKILRPDRDLGMVLGFNQRVHPAQGPTNDLTKLKQGLDKLKVGGETAVYDAVRAASQQLMKIRDTQPSRRAIVVISDGEDNRSKAVLQDAIDASLHADAVVYVLSTNPELSISLAQDGDRAMAQLAESTCGRLLRAGDDDDVRGAFAKVTHELRSQYVISYKPAIKSPDGLFHHLIVMGPKKLRVYHRLGYFAR